MVPKIEKIKINQAYIIVQAKATHWVCGILN
jgi:hypothetical protein